MTRYERLVARTALIVSLVIACGAVGSTVVASSSVNTLTGVYSYDRIDASATLNGAPVVFRRTYNSTDTRVTPLGPGWTHNFGMHVARPAPGSLDLLVVGPQGRTDTYTWNPDGSGTYLARPDLPVLSLVRHSTGEYVATQEDGSVYTFDTQGRLVALAEPGKQRLTVVQGPFGATSVLAPSGQPVLSFEYDAQSGRLISVTDVPDPNLEQVSARVVRFGYDNNGRLETVTDRDGQLTRYAYYGDGMQLASITDANGHQAITLTYDDQGRVATRTDARGLLTHYSSVMQYSSGPDGTAVTTEMKVPSGLNPSFAPTIVSQFDSSQRLISETTQPAAGDNPEVLSWNWGQDPMQAQTSSRVGGDTPQPGGALTPARRGEPGGAAVVVGDPADPRPTPVCVSAPPVGSTPRAKMPWSMGTVVLDPRLTVLRVASIEATAGSVQKFDGFHRLVDFRDRSDGEWSIDYDNEDRPLHIAMPGGGITQFDYDAVGNVLAIKESDGQLSTFQYDERDSLVEAHWASGDIADYEYDDRGDLLRASVEPSDRAATQVAEYAFDGLHRLRRIVRYLDWPNPDPRESTEFSYDAAGECAAFRS